LTRVTKKLYNLLHKHIGDNVNEKKSNV